MALAPTAVTTAVGTLVFHVLSATGRPWVALTVSALVTVVVNLVLLRLLAATIVRDAVGIVPVPDRYVSRVRRLLRLQAVGAA